jgi:hypothetical protein
VLLVIVGIAVTLGLFIPAARRLERTKSNN